MRWPVLLSLVPIVSLASAAPASDPAFLGIGMQNMGPSCRLTSITLASPAQDAGLLMGDTVNAIDGRPLAGPNPCDLLTSRIVEHKPGEQITLDVRRGAQLVTIKATLSTRSDVLHRRFVGEEMVRTDLIDLDNDDLSYDLGTRGKTRVVGWFTLANCTGCARIFDRVSDGLRKRLRDSGNMPDMLAVTAPSMQGDLKVYRKSFSSSVPLAVADDDLFESLALRDSLRISFMVIDCRGVVRFVAPIAPDADDIDAAVDDILAAAEQAEHQRVSRR